MRDLTVGGFSSVSYRAHKLALFALGLFLLGVPVAEIFAGRSISFSFGMTSLFALPYVLLRWRDFVSFLRPSLLFVGIASVLVVLQVVQSDAPAKNIRSVEMVFVGAILASSVLYFAAKKATSHEAKILLRLLLVGVCLASFIAAFEWIFGLPLNGLLREMKHVPPPFPYELDRGLNVLSLLFWPLLSWTLVSLPSQNKRHQVLAAYVLPPILSVLVYQTMSQSASVGLMVGYLVFVAVRLSPVWAPRLLQAGLLAGFMGAPWLALALRNFIGTSPDLWTAASAGPRIEIWSQTAEAIMQSPLTGHGVEAVRAMMNFGHLHNHPHCGPLELWLEFGFVGPLFVSLLLWWLINWLKSFSFSLKAPALAALGAAVLIYSVGYGIWQAWWMATLATIPLAFILVVKTYAASDDNA